MKYNFTETQGCTAFNFTINNKPISEITDKEQEEILDYLFLKVKKEIKENTVQLQDVVKLFQPTEWGSEESCCDQCGDKISWEVWEI